MKYIISWKDFDAVACNEDGSFRDYYYAVPDEHYEIFRQLGIDEYITIEVDTDAKTARVIGRGE